MSPTSLVPLAAAFALLAAIGAATAGDPAGSEKSAAAAKQNAAGPHGQAAHGEPARPPKKTEVWSAEEIAAAQAHCAAVLKTVEAVTIPEGPFRSGACGTAAPVKLITIGSNPQIALS